MSLDQDEALEDFIMDWYYDEESHELARQMGSLLLDFILHLEENGLSEKTIRKHRGNCWLIGKFECDYGYHDTFSPRIFLRGAGHLYVFERKVSRSRNAVNSYKVTGRKLAKYVKSLGFGYDE